MQPECSNAINTRLWRAAKAGVVLELNWLLREPGVDVNWRHAGKDGSTALHAACSFGQTQAISLLLGAGADPNAVDVYGRTPLHYSAHTNCPAAFALVAEAGGQVDHPDVEGVSPLKMALAAGWNSFAYSVQQLLQPPRAPMSASSSPQVLPPSSQSTLSSVHRSQTPAIPPTFQSNLESLKPQAHVEKRHLFQTTDSTAVAAAATTTAVIQRIQPDASQSISTSDPVVSFSPSTPRPAQQIPASCSISRAFQLRNDSDVLVRLILRDDQGGGDGFCHVDTLLAPRIVFPALRRGFQLPARPFFVVLAWHDTSRVLHHAMYRLPGDDSCSFLCAVENGSGRAEGVSLSLVPQSCVDFGASRIGSRTLAGNVECESLFLISRGTALPHSWCADSSASSAAQTPGGQAAAVGAKDCADSFSSFPPSVSSLECSQSSYGSKRVQFSKTVLTHQISPIREYGFSPSTADEIVELNKDFAITYPSYPSSPCWPMC